MLKGKIEDFESLKRAEHRIVREYLKNKRSQYELMKNDFVREIKEDILGELERAFNDADIADLLLYKPCVHMIEQIAKINALLEQCVRIYEAREDLREEYKLFNGV